MVILVSTLKKAGRSAKAAKAAAEAAQGIPSNKSKTSAAQGDSRKGKDTSGSRAPLELTPIIDKLSITLTIPKEDQEDVHNAVYTAFLNEPDVFQSAKPPKGFKSARLIAIPGSAERVHFSFGSKTGAPPHARFEFNPGKLGEDGMDHLFATLVELLPDGWEYVLLHGRITRLDVAVDIPDARMHQFLLLPAQGLTSTRVYSAKGKLKTVYIGKKEGSQTALYSKSAEQAAKKVFQSSATVRLERRLRNPAISSLPQLGGMKNPFAALKLIKTMPPAPNDAQPWVWQLFLDAVAGRGLTAALMLLPEKRKTIYRKHLDQHQVDWWDPADAWIHWPKALKDLGIPVG